MVYVYVSAIATIEANAARKVKEYRHELESYKSSQSDLLKKYEEVIAVKNTVESTLSSVLADKERLVQENKEMKAVCEELMAMVEGEQQ